MCGHPNLCERACGSFFWFYLYTILFMFRAVLESSLFVLYKFYTRHCDDDLQTCNQDEH